MTNHICAHCATPCQRKYCSRSCSYQYRKARQDACTKDGCDKPQHARRLCGPHYADWHRSQRKYTITCAHCGSTAQVARKNERHCSRKCGSTTASLAAAEAMRHRPPKVKRESFKQCAWCNVLHTESGKMCSTECVAAARGKSTSKLGPLRVAYESRDYSRLTMEIKKRTSEDEDRGCWVWVGRIKRGYAVMQIGDKKQVPVHRAMLEAKLGMPLGEQAAHHMCGNSLCVNPEHLQQVTCRENVAEMLARTDYTRRIGHLERALAALDPDHPLLHEAPLGGVIRVA
ncbi:hypothetical protein nbrc107696_06410 [Gordonia spumicola]|uniref:HNH nuclease domain-containing protein n=2 Tax=Gordonia spumicola TaxID=589161 RepID=A0A7I9V432_9ACTN|nr:hypothetical protein nbrc107696_06410 [Gordonia spumicola]